MCAVELCMHTAISVLVMMLQLRPLALLALLGLLSHHSSPGHVTSTVLGELVLWAATGW